MRRFNWLTLKIVAGIAWMTLAPWLARAEKGLAVRPIHTAASPGVATDAQNPAGSDARDAGGVETGIPANALRAYSKSVHELHAGSPGLAEADARRAIALDHRFADAYALAATADLALKQFDAARALAAQAVQLSPAEEKGWVAVATADNYLGQPADALQALSHIAPRRQNAWQVAYQWARAEAGLGDAREALDWANRAALTAPPEFAPLHLLRASALLAAGQPLRAADELESYLQLLGANAPERAELLKKVEQLRQAIPAPGDDGWNALAN